LAKVDVLEQAKNQHLMVILQDYRSSNSNDIRDRLVEPFHISPPEDSIHAFDIEKGALRHFRISRVKRIQITEQVWENEGKHYIRRTDPFRIVDDNQERIHIRFKVGAYNELIERFPLAKSFIEHDAEDEIYDFECKVNAKFFGLTNFILGFHHQMVEIIEPESLVLHIRAELEKIQEKLGVG
jgi:predicted DNA-binding transcriptional regulator YafY